MYRIYRLFYRKTGIQKNRLFNYSKVVQSNLYIPDAGVIYLETEPVVEVQPANRVLDAVHEQF